MWDITKAELARYIDQTNLRPEATEREITEFVLLSRSYNFRTVAIMTAWVPLATRLLQGSTTSIVASVGFPLGTYPTQSKVTETKWAIKHGRDNLEIDMVMNLSLLKSHRYKEVEGDIHAVVEAAGGHTTKVIIEVPLLSEEEIIIASMIAEQAGVDYIKTSTGFKAYPEMRASTSQDVRLIRSVVNDRVKIKIAGGVFSLEQALDAVDVGAHRIGTIAGIPILEALDKLS
jgi:deoxyribose-phosphate aldolase